MATFWTSFWTDYDRPVTGDNPGFFCSGMGCKPGSKGVFQYSICVWIEATAEANVWEIVKRYYPDYRFRFIMQKPFCASDRFPNALPVQG